MPDNLPQQVDIQLPPETSSVVVAKVVYGLHALSIIIGVVTGGSILGAFLFGWPSIVAVILNYVMRFFYIVGRKICLSVTWYPDDPLYIILTGIFYQGFFLLLIWFIGFFIMSIWVGYRIIRGAIRLWNAKPI